MLVALCYNKVMNRQILHTENLIKEITTARLSSYNTGNNLSDEALLENYIYNIKVAEAFYPALALLEVTLRNKLCFAIESSIKSNWLLAELENQQILDDKEYSKLLESANKLKNTNKKITNDRLIAEMTFGFWIHLFTKSYKPKLWDKKGFFEKVFPNYSRKNNIRSIAPIQNDLMTILRLRNRIFHHEIIINGKISVESYYQIIMNLLYLMSADMSKLLQNTSRLEQLIKQKP